MVEIVIGSRGSALALVQTNWVADRIKHLHPGVVIHIEVIKTQGDKILDIPLSRIGGRGLFVKEIEFALLEGKIDIAVHSMKDLPTDMAEGLMIGAVPSRVDPSDALLSNKAQLSDLPQGARIGSSSLRRRSQLMHIRPDLEFNDLRGNLDTRIKRLESGDYDAVIVANAGLKRLGWNSMHLVFEKLPFEVCLPAVGQGALAAQVRVDDTRTIEICPLDDELSHAAVMAERALLSALEGGCQTPIAALAQPNGDKLVIDAMVASLDGHQLIRAREIDSILNVEALGKRTADALLNLGVKTILEEIRRDSEPTGIGAA